MKSLITVFSFLCLFACQDDPYETHIKVETLVNVVADLQLAQEALNKSTGAEKDSLMTVYKEQIFKIHKVDPNLVELDLVEIRKRAEYFKDFYDKVVLKLEEMEEPNK